MGYGYQATPALWANTDNPTPPLVRHRVYFIGTPTTGHGGRPRLQLVFN